MLFPIILLLGLNGLLVGILQSYEHFTIPAIAPAVWNAVIIVLLVVLAPHFHGDDRIYAFSVGILVATVVQLGMSFAALGRIDFRLSMRIDWHDPRIKQVFMLMLPVAVGLGIVNLDQVINAGFGSLVSEEAPRAIENAFRVYMLPQGLFSVAVATVLFPTLSRMASRRDPDAMRSLIGNGMRQINLLMIPAMTFLLVLAEPVVRLLFQRHEFNHTATHLVAIALFWFALSLPFGGLNLLLTRTFFAVQRPWIPTRLAAINIVVDIIVSLSLYKPLGVAGLVIGTVAANAVMTGLQLHRLRIGLNGRLDLGQTVMITARIFVASALLAGVSWGVWKGLETPARDLPDRPDRERRRRRGRGRVHLRPRGAGDARPRGPPGPPPDPAPSWGGRRGGMGRLGRLARLAPMRGHRSPSWGRAAVRRHSPRATRPVPWWSTSTRTSPTAKGRRRARC